MEKPIIRRIVEAFFREGQAASDKVQAEARDEIINKTAALIQSYSGEDVGYVVGCMQVALDGLYAGMTELERKSYDYVKRTTKLDTMVVRVTLDDNGNIVPPKR